MFWTIVAILFVLFCLIPAACIFAVFQIGQGSAQVQVPPQPPAIVQEYVAPDCDPFLNGQPLTGWNDMGQCFYMTPTEEPVYEAPVQPAAPTTSGQTLTCSDGRVFPVPVGGQLFPANDGMTDYSVIYDPTQSGAADLPGIGWWYQPCLPGPHKAEHSAPLILQGNHYYRFIGSECTVYFNYDGNHPYEEGTVLVDHANNPYLYVPATSGHGTESYVVAMCDESDASGFSFALLK